MWKNLPPDELELGSGHISYDIANLFALLYFLLFNLLAAPRGMWDLSSPTRD